MQSIITSADHISSGWDRAKFNKAYNKAGTPGEYKKIRLLPIFEHLTAEPVKPPQTSKSTPTVIP